MKNSTVQVFSSEVSEFDIEDFIDQESCVIFSDPESEWTGTVKVEEPEDELYYFQPESERGTKSYKTHLKDYKIPGFTYENMDT